MVIHKYPLEITDWQVVNVGDPAAEVLSVGEQNDRLVMWVLRNPDLAHFDAEIGVQIYGTGHLADSTCKFVGTVQMSNGLVWHVFVQ